MSARTPQSVLAMVLLLVVLLGTAAASSLRYDQTQTGDTNIHLQVKNVEVLALLDDSVGAEYDYDYNDFTEKPAKPVPGSNSSLAGTSNSNSTGTPDPIAALISASPAVSALNSTNSTAASATDSSTSASDVALDIKEPLLASTASAPAAVEDPTPSPAQTTKKSRRCGAGFYRDTSGRCRRIRRPHLQ
ncbi:uncharacterized protein LOC124367786 isoform X2 [Homalodisca vitripennis]|nr:uncharacterized protein LOC124367786 isoform X2 [Homalodisca vitripennis]